MSKRKTDLRQHFRRKRRQLMVDAAEALHDQAVHHVPAWLPVTGRLGLYWPLAGESDLRSLALLPELEDRLALPCVDRESMHYRAWRKEQQLAGDATGIPAPLEAPALSPEAMALLLVPALALDRQGIRLGYGGGWFDRLRRDQRWRAVPAWVVLPAGCVVEALPRDPWDVPFDGWLDEQGLHWLQAV
jgi:5-formyltetrahydrofolate cyclo-ligase